MVQHCSQLTMLRVHIYYIIMTTFPHPVDNHFVCVKDDYDQCACSVILQVHAN